MFDCCFYFFVFQISVVYGLQIAQLEKEEAFEMDGKPTPYSKFFFFLLFPFRFVSFRSVFCPDKINQPTNPVFYLMYKSIEQQKRARERDKWMPPWIQLELETNAVSQINNFSKYLYDMKMRWGIFCCMCLVFHFD